MEEIPLTERIKNMLDELPPTVEGERRALLTKQDARWLANLALVIAENQGCHFGLSNEQATALKELSPESIRSMKDMVKERRKILALVGTVVVGGLAYVGERALDIFGSDFWRHLFHIGK